MGKIKGYKGFDKDLKCRDHQYEVGQEYTMEGEVKTCERGFHFCENPLDVLAYYEPNGSRYAEVEGDGDASRSSDDTKVAVSKLHISAEITLNGLLKAGVKFILDRVKWEDAPATNTGYSSAATNTGDRSAATNTGYRSAATNTGNSSAATNTGDSSAATNTGDRSAATNTGYSSAATNTGDRSAATNTGDRSAATNTGDRSAATNTGNRSAATNTGDRSAATNTGDRSAAIVSGQESVAMSIGIDGRAKGALGCWIVLAEWEQDKNYDWHRIDVRSFNVDGKKILADTFYVLKCGKAVAYEN